MNIPGRSAQTNAHCARMMVLAQTAREFVRDHHDLLGKELTPDQLKSLLPDHDKFMAAELFVIAECLRTPRVYASMLAFEFWAGTHNRGIEQTPKRWKEFLSIICKHVFADTRRTDELMCAFVAGAVWQGAVNLHWNLIKPELDKFETIYPKEKV